MSATLEQSMRWDSMTEEQKRAAACTLIRGQHYQVELDWLRAVVQCVNPQHAQFRVIKQEYNDPLDSAYPDLMTDLTGWLVTIKPSVLAALKPCPAP